MIPFSVNYDQEIHKFKYMIPLSVNYDQEIHNYKGVQ